LGEPFTVTIHSLDVSSLPKETSIGGKGPSNQSTHIHSWLIKVWNNNNNYCLFYALELTRKHVTKDKSTEEIITSQMKFGFSFIIIRFFCEKFKVLKS